MIMKVLFQISKLERKVLAQKIAELTGETVRYCGAPTFAYQIGGYRLDKNAVLENADGIDSALLQALTSMGYAYSPDTVNKDEISSAPATNEATTAMYGSNDVEQEATQQI